MTFVNAVKALKNPALMFRRDAGVGNRQQSGRTIRCDRNGNPSMHGVVLDRVVAEVQNHFIEQGSHAADDHRAALDGNRHLFFCSRFLHGVRRLLCQ